MDSNRGRAQAAGRFEELVRRHADLVYRVAHVLCGDVHDAEDLTQETFLRAYRAFATFEEREHGASGWLISILQHVSVDRWRAKSRQPVSLDEATLDEFAAEAEKTDLAADLGSVHWENVDEELLAALRNLPMETRAVLLMWALGDMSYREIAQALGCRIGTVMSRLARGRRMLTQALKEYGRSRGMGAER